jgi:hypothetical protein
MNTTEPTPAPIIPATGPRLVARFLGKGGRRVLHRPVVAYDEQGFALIVDLKAGRLVRANANPIFAGLELATRKPKSDDVTEEEPAE